MNPSRREPGQPVPSAGSDPAVARFGELCDRLVLLDERPLPAIRFAVDQLELGVRAHIASFEGTRDRPPESAHRVGPRATQLASDHQRFGLSLEQIRWLLGILEREDHGGHRQALGQYGRVFVEAYFRHRSEEDGSISSPPTRTEPSAGPTPRKP